MAQTKKKRRRKHKGTQGGKVDDRPRGRPRSRAEAKQRAQTRRTGGGGGKRQAAQRPGPGTVPPTWASAGKKALLAGVVFFVLLAVLFKHPMAESAALAGFMLLFYIPMAYYTDKLFYNRRKGKEAQAKVARSSGDADD